MRQLIGDIRYAGRVWSRTPAFAILAVGVLTVGIGVNSAVLSIVNQLFLRPLPGSTGTLVSLHTHDHARPGSYRPFSYANYVDIRDSGVFEGVLAQAFTTVAVPSGETTMRRTFAGVVSANYFDLLGVTLAAGRPFAAAEERPGAGIRVAIASYATWQAAGRASSFVGSTVRINAQDFTVVGIAPRGFTGTLAIGGPELWLPLGVFEAVAGDPKDRPGTALLDRARPALLLGARLPRGVGRTAIDDRLRVLSGDLERAYPTENQRQVVSASAMARLTPGVEPESDAELRPIAALLLALSVLVLAVACFNVANMLLARNTTRTREIALRVALGATRARVVRQLVTESLLLALVAAVGGLLVAYFSMRAFSASVASVLPVAFEAGTLPDWRVVAATLAAAVFSTLLFGTLPALKASRHDITSGLRQTRLHRTRRLSPGNLLVAGQLALSLALIVAAAIFGRATLAAATSDPGFGYDGALVAAMDAGLARMDEASGRSAYRDIIGRIRAVPGVEAAAVASSVPRGDRVEVASVSSLLPRATTSVATIRVIGTDYFRALGRPVLQGRAFTPGEEESAGGELVAIVDEALSRQLFAGQAALGESIRVEDIVMSGSATPLVARIVGIAPPIREDVTSQAAGPHVYLPFGQHYRAAMHVHVKAADARGAGSILAAVGREIRTAAPGLPLLDLGTLRALHDRSLALWVLKAGGAVLACLGLIAVALATAGVYGLRSYVVSMRTRELCIRMAVGAGAGDILRLVTREGASLTLAALAAGVPLAIATAIVLKSVFWGLTGVDPAILLLAPLVLACTAILASYLPARRAARLQPMAALRGD